MTKHSNAGKGDTMRPTDHEAYSRHFETVFGGQPSKDAKEAVWPFPATLIPHGGKLPEPEEAPL